MPHGHLMNNVKVKRDALLVTLRSNLEKHSKEVAETAAARRVEMLDYFKQAAEKLESDPDYQPRESIQFPMPKNNADDYRRAIKMVEMSIDEVIELTEDQFDKLVMDNWIWKQDFLRTSSLYGKLK